jgi:predicted ATPase/class 3 adenylate cyclase
MSELPSGIITFLFTDVEGSTRLWEKHPDAMRLAMARHDALIEESVTRNSGNVVRPRGEGDSRFGVFSRATDAVCAARDIQQALVLELWTTPRPLHVRMALHTGEADLRAGDYYGSEVNRCARLRALASGGQTLLSQATFDLVRDALPAQVSLTDLGEHRLKDLQRSEHVYQVDVAGLQADFPPLQSIDSFPNNLPVQLTSFVGREHELSEVKQRLGTTHLLTLTGPGGTGKTRLSLQFAADILETFRHGVWFVELAPIADPALLSQTVAFTLGVQEQPGRAILDSLMDYLRSKQLLLILDNCEHLIDACAQHADRLLRASPYVKILASSREALGIAGESVYRVPSLSVLKPGQAPTFDTITKSDCVRLFVERASAAQSGFRLTEKNAPSIAQICIRLDGIPLAVELAAARVKMFTPEQVAARLDDRFRLLTGGSRTALPRQQTLRALIDWSYDLLAEPERILLRRLSVFSDGWTFEAAEAVCAGEGIEQADVLDLLTHLADKSLVGVEQSDEEGARYRLLETIRQYARDKLLDSGESVAVRDRHLDFFLAVMKEADPKIRTAEGWQVIRHLQPDLDNLRAALGWGMDHRPDLALQLVGLLSTLWIRIGHPSECKRWLVEAFAKSEALPPLEGQAAYARQVALGRALTGSSFILITLGENAGASRNAQDAIRIWRELGDREWLAIALLALGIAAMMAGEDPRMAVAASKESLNILRSLQNKWGLAMSLTFAASVVGALEHDFASAHAYLEESIRLFEETGDSQSATRPYEVLGRIEFVEGDYEAARAAFQASLDGDLASGARLAANQGRGGLADAERGLGHYDRALSLYRESIAEWREFGNQGGIARCLECIAFVLVHQAEDKTESERGPLRLRAARVLGAAERMREMIGAQMTPLEQIEYEGQFAILRAELEAASLSAAWAKGRELTMEQAIADATTQAS